jgi:hypothetical protein
VGGNCQPKHANLANYADQKLRRENPFEKGLCSSDPSMQNRKMERKILYRETISSRAIGIFTFFVAFLWVLLALRQPTRGPVDPKPAVPAIFFAILAIVTCVVGIVFNRTRIQLTDSDISISWLWFRKTLAWKDISACEIDTMPAFIRGWGVGLGTHDGKIVWVYGTFGGKRVAFVTKDNIPRGMLVSTRNPEILMQLAKERIAGPSFLLK